MSDSSQGAGWWMASDGKWYPPELYPTDWVPPAAAESAGESTAEASDVADVAAVEEVDGEEVDAAVEDTPAEVPVVEVVESEEVADDAVAEVSWVPPTSAQVTDVESSAPPVDTPSDFPPPAAPSMDTAPPPTAEDVPPVVAPELVEDVPQVVGAESAGDMPLGPALAGLGGAAMVVGSVLEWASPTVDPDADVSGQLSRLGVTSQLDVPAIDALSTQSNSIGVLAVGVVTLMLTFLLFAKVRHIAVKFGVVIAGLVGVGLAVYSYIDLSDLSVTAVGQKLEGVSFDISIGLWVALIGAVVAVVGGLLSNTD